MVGLSSHLSHNPTLTYLLTVGPNGYSVRLTGASTRSPFWASLVAVFVDDDLRITVNNKRDAEDPSLE